MTFLLCECSSFVTMGQCSNEHIEWGKPREYQVQMQAEFLGKGSSISSFHISKVTSTSHALCFRSVELTLKSLSPGPLPEAQRTKSNTLWKATGPWSPGNARRHRAVRTFVMDILIISCICGHPALRHAKHNWEQKQTVSEAKQTQRQNEKNKKKPKSASHS